MADLTLATDRLTLRPFRAADASAVQTLVSAWEVARMTAKIPHPYPDGEAARWIATHAGRRREGTGYYLAAVADRAVVGCVSLVRNGDGPIQLGYWVGLPFWGRGFGTAMARAMVGFGFDWLGQSRIDATYIAGNTASGRILSGLGFVETGRRQGRCGTREAEAELITVSLARDAWPAETL